VFDRGKRHCEQREATHSADSLFRIAAAGSFAMTTS
jgi:hypothetical protein